MFEVSMRLERERGVESGLYWSTYRGLPGPDTRVDAGQLFVQATDEGWRTLCGLVPLEPEVRYLCLAVGGFRNRGSVLLVRAARVVALSR